MAKINDTSAYPVTTPANLDRLVGTDVSNTTNDANGETVSFRVQDILGTQHDHTLSDITDAGTAAGYDVGTGANQIVQLTSGAALPAVNSASLTHSVPSGGIIMWSGAVSAIPSGWVLCNGANGTPDLRGRFIIGAQGDAGNTYDVGDTGGQSSITSVPAHSHTSGSLATDLTGSHTHGPGTLSTGTGGGHNHSFSGDRTDVASNSVAPASTKNVVTNLTNGTNGSDTNTTTSDGAHSHNVNSGVTDSGGGHSHTVSGSTGTTGSASVDIRPPYYALAYIMKT